MRAEMPSAKQTYGTEKLIVLLVALGGVYTVFASTSCTNDTPFIQAKGGTGPGDDTGGPPAAKTFTPPGCDYVIAAPEIQGFETFDPHSDVASASGAPKHVHIGLGGDVTHGAKGYADPSTSFVVGWQTDDTTKATKIRFGEAETKLDKTTTGYSFNVLQQAKAGPADGIRFHETHVCGLTPGRTYYYQVGGGAAGSELFSPTYSFTTAPAADGTDPVKFGFVGDTRDALGRSELPIWKGIANRYKADGERMVLFSGDIVLVGLNQDMWDKWTTAADSSAPSVFFALAPGNHDNEQIRFFAHASMPGANTKNAERYSSWDYGPVHVVMIDDYPGIVAKGIDDTGYREEVLPWLEKDLQKADANRAKVPWIVTFHHHPLYSDTTNVERAAEREKVREAMQGLFDKYKVTLDLAGHDHFYERFKPILSGDKEDPNGTTYVICAAAGAPAYNIKPTPISAFSAGYDPDKNEGIYGIATVTKAKFEAKIYKFANAALGTGPADDTVIDTFEFTK